MLTMNTRDVANSLGLIEACHHQTRSMTILTWLMIVYAPLSFAAGIFGMNLAPVKDSKLEVTAFYTVAFSLFGATVVIAAVFMPRDWHRLAIALVHSSSRRLRPGTSRKLTVSPRSSTYGRPQRNASGDRRWHTRVYRALQSCQSWNLAMFPKRDGV